MAWKPSKEDYKRYYRKYHASDEAKKDRAARNRARRNAEKDGKVSKGDGKEVDHIVPLSKGGSRDAKSNQRVVSRTTNRKKKDKTA
jgi:hypothetical protein